ncbi:MAG: 30S ribosomal protein S27e [Nanoarchaeota archaeon]
MESRFLKTICPRCKQRQIIFGKASSKVKCLKCKYLLMKTSGGKAKVRALIKEVLWT